MQIPAYYEDEKDTFPKSIEIDWEATFLRGRTIAIEYAGSPSPSVAPENPFKVGDWIFVPDNNYVGLIIRLLESEDGFAVEVKDEHGFDPAENANQGVECARVYGAESYKDVTWMINSESSTPTGATINGVLYPDGTSMGGANFIDNNFKPLIIDAADTKVYVTGIA
jgi:hypothetical protein